jgi:hypothetical protein
MRNCEPIDDGKYQPYTYLPVLVVLYYDKELITTNSYDLTSLTIIVAPTSPGHVHACAFLAVPSTNEILV